MRGILAVVATLAAVAISAACTEATDAAAPVSGPLQRVTGCSYDNPQWTPNPPHVEKQEEIYGNITTSHGADPWEVSLLTRDAGSASNQVSYFSSTGIVNFGAACSTSGPGHANSGNTWGWYGLGFDGQCANSGTQTDNDAERHRTYNGTFPQTYENHCVKAGNFDVVLEDDGTEVLRRSIDFVAYNNPGVYRTGGNTNVGMIENPGTSGFGSEDGVVFYDDTHTGSTATVGVEITATLNRTDTTWVPLALQSGAYQAPSNYWLRFSAGTTTPATGVSSDQVLVRYFWNWGVTNTDVSGFANVWDGSLAHIRVKQFASGTRTVRAHVVQPYERPTSSTDTASTSYGAETDLPLNIYGAFTTVISPASTSVPVGTSVSLSETGSNGAGSNTWTWRFGDGSGSTGSSVSHTYTTVGTFTYTVTKTDLYSYTQRGTGTVTTTLPTAPTSFAIGTVTSTTAGLTWDANSIDSTIVQDRLTGAGSWTTAARLGTGAASSTLTGLTACNSYDAQIYHTYGTYSSSTSTLTNAIHTPAASGVCAPTNFTVVSCVDSVIGPKTYMYLHTSWKQTEFSSGATTEVAANTTNNSGTATVVLSQSASITTALLGPYLEMGSYNEYFWVRHKNSGGTASSWVALDANPLRPPSGCGA